MRDQVYADHLALGCHGVNHHPVDALRKRFVHTGSAVEKHIQDLRCGLVRVFGLHNGIAALHEIGAGVLFRRGQHPVDPSVIVRLISADGLILIYQKEAPGKRFSGAHILNKPDIILRRCLALLIILLLQLLSDHRHMLVGIGFSGNALELEPHR